MLLVATFALAVAFLSAGAAVAMAPSCPAPAVTSDGWKVATPAQEGLDPALICAIGPVLEHLKNADPHAVVVIRHGVLVYEHYFSGGDEHAPGGGARRRRP